MANPESNFDVFSLGPLGSGSRRPEPCKTRGRTASSGGTRNDWPVADGRRAALYLIAVGGAVMLESLSAQMGLVPRGMPLPTSLTTISS
jgi:hypothetical protein